MSDDTYYTLLEVEESASTEEIKSAFRRLSREYHPDTIPKDLRSRRIGQDAEETFKLLSDAYRVLSNPELRKRYDEQLDAQRSPARRSGRPEPEPPPPRPRPAPASKPPPRRGSPPPPPPPRPSPPARSRAPLILLLVGTVVLFGLVSSWVDRSSRSRTTLESSGAASPRLAQQVSRSQPRLTVQLEPGETYRLVDPNPDPRWWGWAVSECVSLVLNNRYLLEECPGDTIRLSDYLGQEAFRFADFSPRGRQVSLDLWADYSKFELALTQELSERSVDIRPGEYAEFTAREILRRNAVWGNETRDARQVAITATSQCADVVLRDSPAQRVCEGDTVTIAESLDRFWIRAHKGVAGVKLEATW